eukprot:gene12177-biopygen9704
MPIAARQQLCVRIMGKAGPHVLTLERENKGGARNAGNSEGGVASTCRNPSSARRLTILDCATIPGFNVVSCFGGARCGSPFRPTITLRRRRHAGTIDGRVATHIR